MVTNLYQRFDTWLRNLSRGKYALSMGIVAFVVSLGVNIYLEQGFAFIQAVAMGLTLGVLYFYIGHR